jgi:hypothetical protein
MVLWTDRDHLGHVPKMVTSCELRGHRSWSCSYSLVRSQLHLIYGECCSELRRRFVNTSRLAPATFQSVHLRPQVEVDEVEVEVIHTSHPHKTKQTNHPNKSNKPPQNGMVGRFRCPFAPYDSCCFLA